MPTKTANYEVKGKKLWVNGESIPLRMGVVYVALKRAGLRDYEGPLTRAVVDEVLQLDRRISLLALKAEIAASAA
jgi:hypothetical protein